MELFEVDRNKKFKWINKLIKFVGNSLAYIRYSGSRLYKYFYFTHGNHSRNLTKKNMKSCLIRIAFVSIYHVFQNVIKNLLTTFV